MSRLSGRALMAAAVAAIGVAAIAAGLVLAGAPSEARLRRLDDRRVADLQQLASAIDLHWSRMGRLPETTTALPTANGPNVSVRDPDSDVEYGYRALAAARYELCADFARDGVPSSGLSSFWAHGTGRGCFTLEAKKTRR